MHLINLQKTFLQIRLIILKNTQFLVKFFPFLVHRPKLLARSSLCLSRLRRGYYLALLIQTFPLIKDISIRQTGGQAAVANLSSSRRNNRPQEARITTSCQRGGIYRRQGWHRACARIDEICARKWK